MILGKTGPSFALTARAGSVSTPDGHSIPSWGYAETGGRMQYPGVTLIVNEGEEVTVTLTNQLLVNTSILFPGHRVTTEGGVQGLITSEAPPGGWVTYRFRATHPGTYMYHSGTSPELQLEMGLAGALIVRPALGSQYAYNDPDSRFDREYLFLLSEMDPDVHVLASQGRFAEIDLTRRWPVYWFINGRNAPDTMHPDGAWWLPYQPYSCMPKAHPGERVLMRVIGAGRDYHPFHHHGNHARVIAEDGRPLQTGPGAGLDLSHEVFTIQSVPGQTADAIFEWTGKDLGWDAYGDLQTHPHTCTDRGDGFDATTREWCADHGKKMPVTLPGQQTLTFGAHYSGSPYMGSSAMLPPGEGGMNPNGGFAFMWHSHTEKEMVNNDIFPGGMMTMMVVEPWGSAGGH
jgi:FtsP/CotA-like multicopper oxidase with cupredoxin domain